MKSFFEKYGASIGIFLGFVVMMIGEALAIKSGAEGAKLKEVAHMGDVVLPITIVTLGWCIMMFFIVRMAKGGKK
ncbi:MAG: hypothetical protein PHG83_00275 [Patescibacteria group bacterium]|nr:hypothetical protein [Patescibacteria group bacterium]